MEGVLVMYRITLALLIAAGAALPIGCNRSASSDSHARKNDHQTLEEAEQAIESQAQQAKRKIDAITAQAEEALHEARARQDRLKKKAIDMSEYAAQLAEDAKDRAEDLPDEIDRAAETNARRWRDHWNHSQSRAERWSGSESQR